MSTDTPKINYEDWTSIPEEELEAFQNALQTGTAHHREVLLSPEGREILEVLGSHLQNLLAVNKFAPMDDIQKLMRLKATMLYREYTGELIPHAERHQLLYVNTVMGENGEETSYIIVGARLESLCTLKD